MRTLLIITLVLVFAASGQCLQIKSFTRSGAIEWESEYTNGTVMIEWIPNLKDGGQWTEIGRIAVTGTVCRTAVSLSGTEAYYRLSYFGPSLSNNPNRLPPEQTSATSQEKDGRIRLSNAVAITAASTMTSYTAKKTTPVESIVAIKSPNTDDFVLLEQARQKILFHWMIIYGNTLVFTNTPGSQADLIDMRNALNSLSGKFYKQR